MTKKITFIFGVGKKKAQVFREALQDYCDANSIIRTLQDYKMGLLKTVLHEDLKKLFTN